MKIRKIVVLFLLLVTAVSGFAQVNQDEFRDLPPVVFINYEGPHAWVNTREEIRQIGVGLGRQINERERGMAATMETMTLEQRRTHSYRFETGAQNRYFVIHCVSGPENGKLDADILGLGVDAGVDHIRNLRVIIQGYLQSAYEYSASDALLLAEFITIYNAVYRGNWDYFSSRFKTQVMDNLTRERAGLSIRYDEWPGRTLIVIPLGHGGAIDTAAISDPRVIEEMRREDDQGVPQRQELVNILEREAEQAERQAQTERQIIREEERRVQEERTDTERERQRTDQDRRMAERERQQIEQERQQIEQERKQTTEDLEAGRITAQEARQREEIFRRREEQAQRREEEVVRREEEIVRREEDTQRREEQTTRREEQIEQRREEAQRLEDFAEQRTRQAQRQREEIARDQQAAIAQETGGVFGVTIERTSPVPMGRLVRINPANGREIRRSQLDMVHVRTIIFTGGKVLAIAGEATGRGAVRLIEINQTDLSMAKQGDNDIRAGSLLWVNGADLYAIMVEDGNNFLGRFNTDLVLQAKSEIQVHQDASVTIQQGRLLTQRSNGSPLALNPADLSEVR